VLSEEISVMNSSTLDPVSGGNVRVTTPPYRNDDLYADSESSFEVVNGRKVEKHMGLIENMVAALLFRQLANFCDASHFGHVVIETMFAIPGSGNDRKPDVAFVSYQTWAANRPIPRVNAWAIVPELVVEVISPNDKAFDVIDKVREYFAGGVREVWQVYSNVKQLLIYDSPHAVRILSQADELIGDPVVPGFRMSLSDLFPMTE
jgi:Uma2 family endonuclease